MKTFSITIVFLIGLIPIHAQNMKVAVNKDAKAYAKAEILINAPVEKVYEIISDIPAWVQWQSAVSKAKVNGNLKEGVEFTWKANGMKIKSKIHTLVENSAIGWTGTMIWIKAVHNWSFSEEGGKTIVVVEENLSGFGSGLMKKSLKEGMLKNLNELKENAEK
ncbi:MAG: SRPBCC family protein [Bacteroidales bacterium]|nr:SRPBCC family protein [Bacteroidales bacterium]MCF8455581.1 SRPBCC family protein [Bacteroidales bacterium]